MSAIAHEKGKNDCCCGAHKNGAMTAHLAPALLYVAVFVGLVVLTAMTVGQSYFDLGKLNLILVLGIATLKALLILGFFMHLAWDNKFYAIVVVAALFFFGVFFTFTTTDADRRNDRDPDQNAKVLPKTGEKAPGGR